MSGIGDFIPPTPENADPVPALVEHLGYGTVGLTSDGSANVVMLSRHECAQLLYELTDDKRWLEVTR